MTNVDIYLSLVNEAQVAKSSWESDKIELVKDFREAIDGIDSGEPWCAGFVGYCLNKVKEMFCVKSSLNISEGCLDIWNKNIDHQGNDPKVGFLVVWKLSGTSHGHIGIIEEITSPTTFKTIEGNTSPTPETPEQERNGNGVFEKHRHIGDMGSFKLLGFLDPYK